MELSLRIDERDVADSVVEKCMYMQEAMKLSKEVSGLKDKVFCSDLGIDPAQWSRIWSGQAHFPHDKIIQFIRICNNLIVPRWIAMQFNMGMHVLQTELERENDRLRAEVQQQKAEMDSVKKFLRETGMLSK